MRDSASSNPCSPAEITSQSFVKASAGRSLSPLGIHVSTPLSELKLKSETSASNPRSMRTGMNSAARSRLRTPMIPITPASVTPAECLKPIHGGHLFQLDSRILRHPATQIIDEILEQFGIAKPVAQFHQFANVPKRRLGV